ncbi:MAG: signal peptide peptidase SppA [Pseudomonadota bacterium]
MSPMKKSTRLLIWTALLGFLLFMISALAVVLLFSFDGGLPGGEPRTLLVKLGGELPDGPAQGAFILDEADFPPLLTEVSEAIRQAADDDDIAGIYMELEPVGLGLAGVQELADALHGFRESGKPCEVQADQLTNKEYLLASACGTIHLAPAGLMLVNGLSMEQTYFAGTLDKVGVKPNFEHVGEFKSAIEAFERTGPSEAAQEATNTLLDSLYEQFVALVARGRGLEPEQVRALIDQAPITPQQAIDAGLVDGLAYSGAHRRGDDDIITLKKYISRVRHQHKTTPQIAVVHAEGEIISGDSGTSMMGGRYVGDEDLIADLRQAWEDDDVVAVVLRVDSPGGSGLASDNIWNAIEELKQEKPVVVSMGDYAASGGYYISMGADHIVAQPGTITGSIGVFGGKMNVRGLYEKVGVSMFGYKRGELADLLSSTQDFSEPGRARFRDFLESFYQLFLSRAAAGREMEVEAMHAVAQGRVWTGAQALERGLVDDLGGLDVAIEQARELAGVEGETGILRLPRQRTVIEEIMDDLQGDDEVEARVAAALLPVPGAIEALRHLEQLSRALGPSGGVAAMLPYTIEVR